MSRSAATAPTSLLGQASDPIRAARFERAHRPLLALLAIVDEPLRAETLLACGAPPTRLPRLLRELGDAVDESEDDAGALCYSLAGDELRREIADDPTWHEERVQAHLCVAAWLLEPDLAPAAFEDPIRRAESRRVVVHLRGAGPAAFEIAGAIGPWASTVWNWLLGEGGPAVTAEERLAYREVVVEAHRWAVHEAGVTEMRRELLVAQDIRGMAYGEVGRLDDALRDFNAVVGGLRPMVRAGDGSARVDLLIARSMRALTLVRLGRFEEALAERRRVVRGFDALRRESGGHEYRAECVEARVELARSLASLCLYDDARRAWTRVLDETARASGDEPELAEHRRAALRGRADTLFSAHRIHEACVDLETLASELAGDAEVALDVWATAQKTLAEYLEVAARGVEAAAVWEALTERLDGALATELSWLDRVMALELRRDAFAAVGRAGRAIDDARRLVELLATPPSTAVGAEVSPRLIDARHRLAKLLEGEGRSEEALEVLGPIVAILDDGFDPTALPSEALDAAGTRAALRAAVLGPAAALPDYEALVVAYARCVDAGRPTLAHDLATVRFARIEALESTDREEDALIERRALVAWLSRCVRQEGRTDLAFSLYIAVDLLGGSLLQAGKVAEALAYVEEALTGFRDLESRSAGVFAVHRQLAELNQARCLAALEQPAESIVVFDRVVAEMQGDPGRGHRALLVIALRGRAEVQAALGRLVGEEADQAEAARIEEEA